MRTSVTNRDRASHQATVNAARMNQEPAALAGMASAVTVVAGMKIADEVEAGAGSTAVKYACGGSCIPAYDEDGEITDCAGC